MENLRDFYDRLNEAERQLSAEVAADRVGLLMRIAINELDLDFEGFHRGTASDEADQERSYIIRIGVVRILKLAMEAHRDFEAPAITIQRDLRYSGPVLQLIAMAGTIEHGRRVAQSLSAVGGRIEKLEDSFRITLPSKLPDLELHERELGRLHVGNHRSFLSEGYEAIIGETIGDEVRTLLTDLVYPFRTHFIGYDADPMLDFYFFGHAYTDMLLAKARRRTLVRLDNEEARDIARAEVETELFKRSRRLRRRSNGSSPMSKASMASGDFTCAASGEWRENYRSARR